MKTLIRISWAILLMAIAALRSSGADGNAKIKVLLITGGHPFEQEPFFKVFRDNPEIALTTAAHGDKDADAYDRDDLTSFDVVVLYDMRKTITEGQRAKFMSLFDKGVGLVVLHHAIVSYQHWPEYEKAIGGKYPEEDGKSGVVTPQAGYKHDEEVPIVIVAKDHPVTAGLKDFTIHDEIYWGFHTTDDVTPLITTTHPKSGKPLAWCRTQGKSRVVYLQLGHDHQAYENPNYQKLVVNSIQWTAKRDK
jgi:type 1 glutamine amidotransferase